MKTCAMEGLLSLTRDATTVSISVIAIITRLVIIAVTKHKTNVRPMSMETFVAAKPHDT